MPAISGPASLRQKDFGIQSQCISDLSDAVIKRHDQGDLRKRTFILAYCSEGWDECASRRVEAWGPGQASK